MFAQVHYPDQLSARELDRYLQAGWFRMGQSVFTTNFLHFKQQFYSAIWLRVLLSGLSSDRSQEKLFRRNRIFRSEFGKASLDITKEELFARYKQGVAFDTSPSLYHLLNGKVFYNLFDTREINLYDGNVLVASGFFDIGENSAAGITSFYNPDYKKYSLGKYLIYLKIHYCREMGLDFFYPGYFVPGYPFFNYKLELGRQAIEYFDLKSEDWKPISLFEQSPFEVMEKKLNDLGRALRSEGLECQLFRYEFFDANLFPELKDVELFDFPVFLNCFPFRDYEINPMAVFDVRDDRYHLVGCKSLWASNLPSSGDGIYSFHLLMPEFEWFATSDMSEMVRFVRGMQNTTSYAGANFV